MIKLPFEIIQLLWNCGNNRIEHLDGFAKEFCDATFDIVSTSPFVIQANNTNILLTRDENDPSIENYQYAVLTNKKPRKSDIIKGNIISIRWLKHPNFKNLQPNEIVASWRGKFLYKKENIQESILGLRAPQLGAIYAFMSKAQIHHGRNIIVMPTGTGKTETMLSILIANQCPKVLITVPSDALRDQISNKFLTLGILPEFGIVASDCNYPIVGVVKEGMDYNGWYTLIEKSNVIITTMPLITNCESAIIDLFKEKISHLFVDEAHHSEAKTWSEFIDSFDDEKVTLFTATPFRNDNRRLRGEFIYNFSLKEAQSQGYYKPIKFIPIREYDLAKADKCIAEVAVNQLRSDLENEYDHILMARCSTKQRAKEIMEIYQQYPDLNPVMVFSLMPYQKAILKDIKDKKHKIIVCVNMLGEGFDMPELKIAAIHDAKQSLPITLQFIGRFTRTSYDSNLGNASFITNIAYPPILEELEELYAKDADWNSLLPLLNDGTTQQEKDFNQFIQSFGNLESSKIPFQSINIPLSAIIYRTSNTWNPKAWENILSPEIYNYRFGSSTADGDTLVVIGGSIENVDWGNVECVQNLLWNILVIHRYCTPKYNHAYVFSTLNETDNIVKAIFGEDDVIKISGHCVFRVFHDVRRFAIVNFGGRKARMGNVSFKSYYGKDVQEGISMTEKKQLTANNLFGNGCRNGERISVGCSVKGKIWSHTRGNLLEYTKWARMIGKLVEDENIDPDSFIQNTLRVYSISELPPIMPIAIDWDPELYRDYPEHGIYLTHNAIDYQFWYATIELAEYEIKNSVTFNIIIDNFKFTYVIEYYEKDNHKTYHVKQVSGNRLKIRYGTRLYDDICDYFNNDDAVPVIYFADGSCLYANNLVRVNSDIVPFSQEKLIGIDWDNTKIENESQHVEPYETDSIQYFFSKYIWDKFDLIYDDDGSGEIADLIGFKNENNAIHMHLFHLKYAHEGRVSNLISNFYEVCGQAQKCLKWNDRDKSRQLFNRLFARKIKKYQGRECSRILKGSEEELEQLSSQVNWKKDLIMHINIVQPGLSCSKPSQDILNLLGCVASYIKDVSNIDLNVYCNL